MRNFDSFVGIDWSGAKTPSKNAIAIATCSSSGRLSIDNTILWTRQAAYDRLCQLIESDDRALVGMDFNFSFSEEIGTAWLGPEYTIGSLWNLIENCNAQHENFYGGDIIEDPKFKSYFWVNGKKPADWAGYTRQTELACAEQGLGFPENPCKLIGPKQVGKAGLSGIRVLNALKKKYGSRLAIWPFDSIDICNAAHVVFVEIYPAFFLNKQGWKSKKIHKRDDLERFIAGRAILEAGIAIDEHSADAIISAVGLWDMCGRGDEILWDSIDLRGVSPKKLIREGWIFGVTCGLSKP